MMTNERDAIDYAKYLMQHRQIKPLSESQIREIYKRTKTICDNTSAKASNDAQYGYEMDCLEDELKKA